MAASHQSNAHVAAYGMDLATDMSRVTTTVAPRLHLHGVHHTARPTWKLQETVMFYRDVMGLPLVHCITARGWGPPGHPDFLHFFFDAGNGATIAFFYYLGTEKPAYFDITVDHLYIATHTAWQVREESELQQWKDTLEARGVKVSPRTRHEVLESIYFMDPNGYPFEITWALRPLESADAVDASLTLDAAIAAEAAARSRGMAIEGVDAVWREKARRVESQFSSSGV